MTQDNEKWSTALDKATQLIGYSPQRTIPTMLPRLATLVRGAVHSRCLYFCTTAKTYSWTRSNYERGISATYSDYDLISFQSLDRVVFAYLLLGKCDRVMASKPKTMNGNI